MTAADVRALLDGRKTTARQLAWRRMRPNIFGCVEFPSPWQSVRPGDRLWVREAFAYADCREVFSGHPSRQLMYRAGKQMIQDYGLPTQRTTIDPDIFANENTKWTSSIHMPRAASRLTLTVTAARVERLQEISEEDCTAEGAPIEVGHQSFIDGGPMCVPDEQRPWVYATPRAWFRDLWDSLHGPGAWDANPEVVALTFTVECQNIDARKAA
jgi:hypothetical protein